MKTLKIRIKFENIHIIFTKHCHLKYIILKMNSHNRIQGYKMTITEFAIGTTVAKPQLQSRSFLKSHNRSMVTNIVINQLNILS